MAASLDSAAVFAARAVAIGITPGGFEKLVAAGFNTMNKFAFSSTYAPGSADDKPLRDLLVEVLGEAPPLGQLAAYRRLFFEAYTLAASDLRARVERTDEQGPRRIAPPERAARHEALQTRLSRVRIEGEHEPSHALLDAINQQAEDGVLRWLDWSKLSKRQQELQGVEREPHFRLDPSGGVLRIVEKADGLSADVSSDLRVRFALMRRALAYESAGLVSFDVGMQWVDYLFAALLRPPLDGYAPVSLAQLIRADQELWRVMAEDTRAGIAPRPDGTKPLQEAMLRLMTSAGVIHLLLPLPRAASSVARDSRAPKRDRPPSRAAAAPPAQGAKAKAKKGAGKGRQSKAPMPAALMGGVPNLPSGEPLCFGYNLGSCPHPITDGRCTKGLHRCCKAGCFGNHPFCQCPA